MALFLVHESQGKIWPPLMEFSIQIFSPFFVPRELKTDGIMQSMEQTRPDSTKKELSDVVFEKFTANCQKTPNTPFL